MMRDLGYHWLWYDKYSPNLVARGFEYERKEKIELISAFELFEHFENPMEEIEDLLTIADSILFSTLLYGNDLHYKEFSEWWYYVPETGQHISFYSLRTLEHIAQKLGIHYYYISNEMHLLSRRKISKRKIKWMIGSEMARKIQQLCYWRQRKQGLASSDMQTILEMRGHKYEQNHSKVV